jgi:hypothetical protein
MDLRPPQEGPRTGRESAPARARIPANTLIEVKLEMEGEIEAVQNEGTSTALFHIAQMPGESAKLPPRPNCGSWPGARIARAPGMIDTAWLRPGAGGQFARHGLSNMSLRAQSVGGRLRIDSAPMRGTTVTATFSLRKSVVVPSVGR